jgi:hypothetical protein
MQQLTDIRSVAIREVDPWSTGSEGKEARVSIKLFLEFKV